MIQARCRFCSAPLSRVLVDLGLSPVSNSFLKEEQLGTAEPRFPLKTFVCEECFLVQIEPFGKPEEIFDDYVYFSSYSQSWLAHAKQYAETITKKLSLGADSLVVEIASNDGYLLQYFRGLDIPVLGVEPAHTVAKAAEAKGIPTWQRFFGVETANKLAAEGKQADLLIGNNVLAHVPDLNDFVAGLAIALKPRGTITMEFPHLMQMIENTQFDTIYHEHYSYLSLVAVQRVFAAHGLTVYDVEEIPTHGGSLRIHAGHATAFASPSTRVMKLLEIERAKGYECAAAYEGFAAKVDRIRADLLRFLHEAKSERKKVAGYGAAAKGNTLLNYCAVGSDLIAFVADANPHKQSLFLPGSHIPVAAPERIFAEQPDYVLILPWNLTDEISSQLKHIRDWGGRFVTAVPALRIF